MSDMTITTWAVTADRDGLPMILASDPNQEEVASALALVRLNPTAKRYTVEPVGVADHGFAARLAREAVAAAFAGGAAWERVRPGDLVPAPEPVRQPASQPERLDPGAIRPDHPRWAAEAAELLKLGYKDADEREAAREKLVKAALAENWSLRDLGHAILRDRAAEYERTYVSPLQHRSDDALAAALFGADTSADVWARVTRPPEPGEVTNATRRAF
jgi:hypothetical protein